ncbi:hypothetical protein NLJ89_g2687 [Agrocybe chaxingu]|uniref:CoA-binding domain-containing protein n=1 Tax=Agrocybe chaxingu TaxID=84603 RepID=A0A9W8K642_9AGAR|nr:hypothetical protein NLJ89_g2687 [Agrocybe chaxingu]
MAAISPVQKTFLGQPFFAVIGASKDTSKFGTKVTLGILQQAKELDVPALWLQPGAEDEAVVEYIKENLADRVIYGGPCILVQGDDIRSSL